jgi:hypothetical protein
MYEAARPTSIPVPVGAAIAQHLHVLSTEENMNNIIYIVGLVVVVLAVLYFLGLA